MLLQSIDRFAGGGHFCFCFGNRGPLTGSAFRFDLLFEIVETAARRFCGRVQIQILRREPLLEVVQFLAQLRGALLHIRDGRVVLGGDDPLAGRSSTSCRTQLSLGRRQLALGLIEVGGEAFGGGQQLVFVPLGRDDIVARPECVDFLPFRRYFLLQRLDRVAQLVSAGPRRFLVGGGQMLLVDAGQGIHQSRQKLPLRALSAQQDHLSALDGFSAQHMPHPVDRIAPDIGR